LALVLGGLFAPPVIAVEVLIEEDIIEGVVMKEQLVRVADNAIFLLDTSSSMSDKFRDTGKTKLELVESVFTERNRYFPEIGHQFGIYTYTPWKEIYPVQEFNREKVAKALTGLPSEGKGPTPLNRGLIEMEKVLAPLTGRIAIFLFSDGTYTGGRPNATIKSIASNKDVCFYVISTAKEQQNHTLKEDIASLNACSRLIPLESFLNRPEYTTGALFDVIATEEVVTTTQLRVAGLAVDDINFGFDKTELSAKDKSELDELGEFMAENPESYAVIAGYTDNRGPEDYNEGLSRRRTETVASYMMEEHGVDEGRIVLHWYGSDNPLTTNDTFDGRAANRRVEVVVGGL